MKWTTRFAYKLLPAHAWDLIRTEWSLTRRRWRNHRTPAKRLLAGKTGLWLHLGCGNRIIPGWINIDAFEQPGLDIRWDLRDPLPCEAGVAEMVYSEHFLEHLEAEDAKAFLREVYRLIRRGGIVRLGVPDAAIYMKAYVEQRKDFFDGLRHLGGAVKPLETPIEVINQMFRMGGHHRYAWDFDTLAHRLQAIGFVNVIQSSASSASRPQLCLDDPDHAFETLYVEAEKPLACGAIR